MIDSASAVQQASFAALNGTTAVTDLAEVWQAPPEDSQPPLVLIGDVSLEPIGGKDGGLDRATFEIVTLIREPDQTALFALQMAVRNAIDGQAITASGALISLPTFLSADVEMLEDGETYMGTQRFETIVQPA
jgi:hypothetical protein